MRTRGIQAALLAAMIGMTAVGCTAAPDGAGAPTSTATHTRADAPPTTDAASEPLAYGWFAPANGVSGNASIERAADALTVTLNSFSNGGPTARLVLVDAAPEQLAECIPADAVTASVSGTPTGPKSSFPFASVADFDAGAVPRFRTVILVRQATEGETGCAEPVLAVAPLTWAD